MKTCIQIVFGLMFLFASVAKAADATDNTYCACSLTKVGYEKGIAMSKQIIEQPKPYLHRQEIEYAKKRLPQLEDTLAAISDYMKTLQKVSCKPVTYSQQVHADCTAHTYRWVASEKEKAPEAVAARKAAKEEADRMVQEANEDDEKRIKNDVWLK